MPGTITETLNSVYTSTWAKRRADVVDQVFEENRLIKALKSKGMVKYENTDGRRFEIPLRIGRPATAKFFGKGATFTISDFDPLTVAYDTYKNLGDQIIRYWEDDKINGSSKTAHLKLMDAKIKTLKNSFQLKMEIAFWDGTTGGTGTPNFNSIGHLIQTS